jgi:hypothetical protein
MPVRSTVDKSNRANRKPLRKYWLIVALLLWSLGMTACSYLTNFVVVNSSARIVEVRYRVKDLGQSIPPIQMLPTRPAIKPASQIEQQNPWRELSTSEFTFDPKSRIVTVLLKPGDALRIEHRNLVDGPQDDSSQAANFAIEEISLEGANGLLRFEGAQARKSFVPQSKKTYTLTYD